MATFRNDTLFDEVLDFLSSTPTLEQIVAFSPSDTLQARVRELLDRNRNEALTAEEQQELDEFQRMNHFMSMLKIRSRKKLVSQ
jgi:hypothetical protein